MSSSRNLTMQDLLNVLNNANNNDKQNNNLQTHASSTETHDLSFYNLSPEIISLPIPKQSGKYNLQKALGLKNQKQRWLGYLVCNVFIIIKFKSTLQIL
ncbi:hypothetical protein RhiirB3_448523 [Rhizophagus irregularis]|nr:hypothetical protein RhiirB3_448523 [Rhizophagus irregularis]